MNKILVIIIAVIIIAGGAWALFGRSGNNNTAGTTGTSNASNSTTSSNSSSAGATATNAVSISNFTYSPASITIKKGTMVTWTNNDNTTHTVTKDNADTGPDSSDLTPGAVYRFTYNQVGTFTYHCKFHSDMHGSVTVTE